jgi:hypothetical protein
MEVLEALCLQLTTLRADAEWSSSCSVFAGTYALLCGLDVPSPCVCILATTLGLLLCLRMIRLEVLLRSLFRRWCLLSTNCHCHTCSKFRWSLAYTFPSLRHIRCCYCELQFHLAASDGSMLTCRSAVIRRDQGRGRLSDDRAAKHASGERTRWPPPRQLFLVLKGI